MPRRGALQSDGGGRSRPEWMVAYVTHIITEAHIIVGRLQHEGIPAIIDHMAGRDAIGLTIGTWGEVRVLVHPENYDAALMLLFPEDADALDDGTQDDDVIHLDDWNADENDDD